MAISTATHGEAASGPYKVNSLVLTEDVSPLYGKIVWDKSRSIWNSFIFLTAIFLAPIYFTWGAVAVFLGLEQFRFNPSRFGIPKFVET